MEIEAPSMITAGGTASLLFALTDSGNQRLANMVDGTATVSLRRESTRRTRHELTHLPTTFDPVAATVQLDLSSAMTIALAPPVGATGKQRRNNVIGDVRLSQSNKIKYYGPLRFRVRLPETYP